MKHSVKGFCGSQIFSVLDSGPPGLEWRSQTWWTVFSDCAVHGAETWNKLEQNEPIDFLTGKPETQTAVNPLRVVLK